MYKVAHHTTTHHVCGESGRHGWRVVPVSCSPPLHKGELGFWLFLGSEREGSITSLCCTKRYFSLLERCSSNLSTGVWSSEASVLWQQVNCKGKQYQIELQSQENLYSVSLMKQLYSRHDC